MLPAAPATRNTLQPDYLLATGFLGFVFLVAIVPASVWLPLKAIAIVMLFVLTTLAFFTCDRFKNALGLGTALVLFYVLIVSGLTAYALYVDSVEFSSTVSAAVRYITVVLIVFAGFLSLQWKVLTASSLLQTIFIGHFSYLILKISALLVARITGLEAEQITEAATMLIPGATVHGFRDNEVFVRIFLGNDAITPFIFALYLASLHRSIVRRPIWSDLFVALNLIGVALTFTRFVWVSMLVVLVVFLIIHAPRVTHQQLIRALATGLISFFAFIFIVGSDGVNNIHGMTSERVGDYNSINEKRIQVTFMLEAFSSSPVVGTGVGSSLEGHDRPDALPFQYEVQWFALLMQLGVVGFLPLLLIASAPLWPLLVLGWQVSLNRDFLFLSMTYGLWLMGAFTNPYLFILNSVLVYLGFLAMSSAAAGALSTDKNVRLTKESSL